MEGRRGMYLLEAKLAWIENYYDKQNDRVLGLICAWYGSEKKSYRMSLLPPKASYLTWSRFPLTNHPPFQTFTASDWLLAPSTRTVHVAAPEPCVAAPGDSSPSGQIISRWILPGVSTLLSSLHNSSGIPPRARLTSTPSKYLLPPCPLLRH